MTWEFSVDNHYRWVGPWTEIGDLTAAITNHDYGCRGWGGDMDACTCRCKEPISDRTPSEGVTQRIRSARFPIMAEPVSGAPVTYDRQVLVDVLVYHYRVAPGKGCGCGWDELGRSWPEHVATVFEESVALRPEPVPACSTCGEPVDSSPPCSRNFATGERGHTRAGGIARGGG